MLEALLDRGELKKPVVPLELGADDLWARWEGGPPDRPTLRLWYRRLRLLPMLAEVAGEADWATSAPDL